VAAATIATAEGVCSCVHAGKVFFSVCFTGGQGYREEEEEEEEDEEDEDEVGQEFYVQLLSFSLSPLSSFLFSLFSFLFRLSPCVIDSPR